MCSAGRAYDVSIAPLSPSSSSVYLREVKNASFFVFVIYTLTYMPGIIDIRSCCACFDFDVHSRMTFFSVEAELS